MSVDVHVHADVHHSFSTDSGDGRGWAVTLRSITVNRSMAGLAELLVLFDTDQERFYSMAGLTWAKPCSRERCYVGRVKRWGGLSESVADWRSLMRTGGREKAGVVGWRWLALAGVGWWSSELGRHSGR